MGGFKRFADYHKTKNELWGLLLLSLHILTSVPVKEKNTRPDLIIIHIILLRVA